MYLNAYYIHQHPYVMPPRHVEDDCRWLQENGFDALSMVINEMDLEKTPRNIDRLFIAAKKAGLNVHLVPSRWGALVAGTPGVRSYFSASHPDLCLVGQDGKIIDNPLWGPMASVNHPATFEFFLTMLQTIFKRWPFDGVIWDEPKIFGKMDLTEAAAAIRPPDAGVEWDNRRFADFFDRVGAHIKTAWPGTRLSMFLYAHLPREIAALCAGIEHLDDLGCDGRPFAGVEKTLLENGLKFRAAALNTGKRPLVLIENHDLDAAGIEQMDRYLPEVLSYGMEHVLVYYYGRNCEEPDRNMRVAMKHIHAHRFESRASLKG